MPLKKTAQVPLSIEQIRQKIKQEQSSNTQQEEVKEEKPVTGRQTNSFNQADLEKAWENMQQTDIAGNQHFYKIILEDGEPELNGKHSIVVTLGNQVLREYFTKFKPQIFKFLSEELQNDLIHLEYNIATPKAGKKRIYTTQDKFEYLANINPALVSLKNKLGLDFDN